MKAVRRLPKALEAGYNSPGPQNVHLPATLLGSRDQAVIVAEALALVDGAEDMAM